MNKKLPSELSIEELLASLDGVDLINDKVEFSYDNPILSFIQAFNIVSGKNLISDKILYDLYKIWHKDTFIKQRDFNLRLGQYIPSKQSNRRFYFVDKKVLELAEKVQSIKEKHTLDRSKSIHWNKHFERFLAESGIESGELYVEGDILYYIYSRWCDSARLKQWLSYNSFLDICAMNFDHKRLAYSKFKWFGVNNKIKQSITKEEVKRWRKGRKKYGRKKRIKEETTDTEHKLSPSTKVLYEEKKVKKK